MIAAYKAAAGETSGTELKNRMRLYMPYALPVIGLVNFFGKKRLAPQFWSAKKI